MTATNEIRIDEAPRLEDQFCFPLYACAKEVVRQYRKPLEALNLTYTQYLVMMVLWEHGGMTEGQLGQKVYLDSGTLAPLLKRMERAGLINRIKPDGNVRKLYVTLTQLLKEKTTVSIIENAPVFLIRIRQDDLVSDFTVYDNCIKEALPTWYEECYKVQFTKNIADDYKAAIEKYLDIIHSDNLRQGKNGYYYESGVRTFDSIKNFLLDDDFSCDRQLFIRIVSEVKDTLLISKEELKNKIDACNLLVYLITKYPEMMDDVKEDIKEIVNNIDSIGVNDRQFFSTNISIVPLRTAIMLLGLCVDEEVMTDLIENMSFLEDDIPSLIVNAKVLNNHLEAQQHDKENPQLDMIVFNNALLWINSKSHELRWYSTKLFLLLGKHSIYTERVNNILIRITSDEGVYIKNLILNNLFENDFIYKETIDTILSICENDYSFHIRNKVKRLKEKTRINC